MKRLRQIRHILMITIFAILLSYSISNGAGENNLTTDTIYNWVSKEDKEFLRLDEDELIGKYYTGEKLKPGGLNDENPDWVKYWRCVHEYTTNPIQSWGFNIKTVIDISSDGTVTVTYKDNKKVITNYVKEGTRANRLFNNWGYAVDKDLIANSKSSYYGHDYYYRYKSTLEKEGVYYVSSNENMGSNELTELKPSNARKYVTKGYKVRILVVTMEESKGQARIFFGRTKDDTPAIGNITIEKRSSTTNKLMGDVQFTIQNADKQYYTTDKKFVNKLTEKCKWTTKNGEITIENIPVGTYTVTEVGVLNNGEGQANYGYVSSDKEKSKKVKTGQTATFNFKNESQLGNLELLKVDADSKKPMGNVGFTLQMKTGEKAGQYVGIDGKGNAIYSTDPKTTIKTDAITGKTKINNLWKGTYILTEVINPHYGYEELPKVIDDNLIISGNGETTSVTAPNKRTFIKLSGYVWVDKVDGKTSERNDLYQTSSELLPDTKDVLFNGITVRLKDRTTGETVKETITSKLDRYKDSANDGNGEYLFTDVLIDKLKDYYIEFEYDGLTYTNVKPKIDINSGSKAAEIETGENSRDEFNKGFSVVEGKERNTGFTRDANGNEKYSLSYNINETGHEATLINNGQYTITANTNVPNFSIQAQYVGQEEIKYINLGLYEREQPDIALVKDLQNVRLTVNGYEHTYNYAQRFINAGEYGDGFNVGVKFGNKYGNMSYSRAIYKADYEYENEEDRDKELKVYVTYQLTIKNQSSNLTAQINSILDYYDSNYKIVGAGTKLDEKGNTIGDIAHLDVQGNLVGNITDTDYNENYKKTIINHTMRIEAQKEDTIYVQFALNKEAVIRILNDKENLDNVAEINSYSIYGGDDGNQIYAGIDIDSNPGNCIPGDIKTYEDDTDSSPALKLEVADSREMAGKVFLDYTEGELKSGKVRQGDGIYKNDEEGIAGVEVTLTENTGSGKEYKTTTDENGDFLIAGFIPGDYTLTYTWGDKTYTVQNYKGTVYNTERDQNDKNWYKQEVDTRYTDAIDNYNKEQDAPKGSRIQIDEEISNGEITRIQMDSSTPIMGIGIEEDTDGNTKYGITSIESEIDGDKFIPKGFKIRNIDFGIIERARQVLDISKDVTGVKITLANGQTIMDAKIANGKLEGDNIKGLTYMGPSNGSNGLVKAEIDNELIQGATIQIEYTINVVNNSEIDYDSEEYYKYGTGTENIIRMKPTVYDYLDSQMALDTNPDNEQWEVIFRDKYDMTYAGSTMIETYFNEGKTIEAGEDGEKFSEYNWEVSDSSYQSLFTQWATTTTEERKVREAKLDNKTILYNSIFSEELEPNNKKSINLYTSKVLANTDEIDLNNDTEITGIKRVGETGRIPDVVTSHIYDKGETVTVTPPTGNNQNYILPIVIGVTALIILGVGVVIIKKKAI